MGLDVASIQPCGFLLVSILILSPPTDVLLLLQVELWLSKFSEELSERLQYDMEQNKRIARTLTLHATAYKVIIFLLL